MSVMPDLERWHIDLLAPPSGRRKTLVLALEMLHDLKWGRGCHIAEMGASRSSEPKACLGDGWATRVFAWYAHWTGGRVTTVDRKASAIEAARKVCGRRAADVRFITADAERAAHELRGVDLLYLDAWRDPQVHLNIYNGLNHRPPLVLVDDVIDDEFNVKGALVIPAMLGDGYRLVFNRDRQALLALEDKA